jgi:hypothetical protein
MSDLGGAVVEQEVSGDRFVLPPRPIDRQHVGG